MSHMKEIDPRVIEQAVRNANHLRSEEFHKVMVSLWRGVKVFAKAVAEGFEAGRKAPDIT